VIREMKRTLMNSVLWINFAKDMNRVWHHFQSQYFTTQFLGNWIDDFFQAFIDTTHQTRATELRTKDPLIFAGV